MPPEILRFEQNSDAWVQARCGLVTASNFSKVLSKGKGGGESVQRKRYLRTLAAERKTGIPAESYSNAYMERGHEQEQRARAAYELETLNEVEQVGFIKNFGCGYSPDGLVGDDGLIEIKTMAGHIFVETFEANRVPNEHRAQCQGGLWISERDWLDFVGYSPGFDPLIFRVERDDEWIEKTLMPAVAEFEKELQELVGRLNGGNR